MAPIKILPQRSTLYRNSKPKTMFAFDSTTDDQCYEKKIPFSNVVVKRKRRAYWVRKWGSWDLLHAAIAVVSHALCFYAPSTFSWGAFWLAVSLYFVIGLFGITISYHRNLSHRAFKLPKWLECLFAYCGILAFQGDPIFWVSNHRYHHQFTDKEKDPHSPIEGFWFSHMNWVFDINYTIEKSGDHKNVRDLQEQAFYRFLRMTIFAHPIAFGIPLYLLGGFPFLVRGMVCGLVNAFEFSARHGQEWWELDLGWYFIKLLGRAGLATDVKVPSEDLKQRMSLKKGKTN